MPEENDAKETNIEKDISKHITSSIITDTLNSLEYFAMNFVHEIADESVGFESLAPSYIKFVQLLYCEIAKLNEIGRKIL